MEGSQVLAEQRIVMERDGVEGRQEVVLQIGHPQWSKGGDDAVCAIAINGIEEDMPPVRGRDFFEVLVKAARTLKQYCKTPPQGVRFFYLGERPYHNERYEGEPFDAETAEAEERRLEALRRDNWSVLVERKILMQEDGTDERTEVVLQIGHPYWLTEGELAACPIAMKGAEDEFLRALHGRDPFEALSNAVRYVNERFAGPQCGRFFFWPDGEPYGGDFDDLPPRRYERDPREISGNWKILAERTLLMEQDGSPRRKTIRLRVGHPYWFEDGKDARCPLEIVGLCDNMPAFPGDTPFTALVSALNFFYGQIHRDDSTDRFFWPDGTPYRGEPLDREPEPDA